MESLTFLERPPPGPPQPLYVVQGDEDFLKREVVRGLRHLVLDSADAEFGLAILAGDKTSFATVHDELATVPLLGSRRLVVVEDADPFVTQHRVALEKYAAQPAPTGVLVLVVKSWPSTTRLARLIPPSATILCKAPPPYKLPDWCMHWVGRYGKKLASRAARLLVELVGPDLGLLDQELAKLATYVGTAATIEARDVDRLVGCSRTENAWKIFDALASGKPAEALTILDRLFDQGEEPHRLLGAFSLHLRRLAQAARLHRGGQPLAAALEAVGVPSFAVRGNEQHLRHLGQRRLEVLFEALLEVDLGLKGASPLSKRLLLERLVVWLAAPRMALPTGAARF